MTAVGDTWTLGKGLAFLRGGLVEGTWVAFQGLGDTMHIRYSNWAEAVGDTEKVLFDSDLGSAFVAEVEGDTARVLSVPDFEFALESAAGVGDGEDKAKVLLVSVPGFGFALELVVEGCWTDSGTERPRESCAS